MSTINKLTAFVPVHFYLHEKKKSFFFLRYIQWRQKLQHSYLHIVRMNSALEIAKANVLRFYNFTCHLIWFKSTFSIFIFYFTCFNYLASTNSTICQIGVNYIHFCWSTEFLSGFKLTSIKFDSSLNGSIFDKTYRYSYDVFGT